MIDYRDDAKWTVYIHIVPKELSGYDWDKYYVGITKQKVEKRWGYSTGIHYKKSTRFYEAIKQFGFHNIKHEIIATNLTKNEAYKFEEILIKELQTTNPEYGYNMTFGQGALKRPPKNIIPYDPSSINRIKSEIPTTTTLFEISKTPHFEKYEIWKNVVGYEGLYEVSNFGRVRSLDRYVRHSRSKNNDLVLKKGRILNEKDNGHGYKSVHLTVNRQTEDKYVHRLVAQSFLDNPNNFPEVNHIDENKSNNCLDNLEWCTSKYNDLYGNHTKNTSKPVEMFDLQMNFIDEFKSITEAEKITGVRGVWAVCNMKRHTAGGYIWRYKNNTD